MYYIYEIKNLINNKTYIGQRKCQENISPLDDEYMGSGELIRKAIKKYGLENFTKIILEEGIETKKEADNREIYWIDKGKKDGRCQYNISRGGTGGNLGEEVNRKQAETLRKSYEENPELRKIVSIKMKRVFSNPIHREALSKAHKEAMNRPEVKEKCRQAHLGKKATEEHIKNLSDAMKGKNTWSKGRKISEETKLKIKMNNGKSYRIFCIELNKEFLSIREASKILNLDPIKISSCCKEKIDNVLGYHFIFIPKENKKIIV